METYDKKKPLTQRARRKTHRGHKDEVGSNKILCVLCENLRVLCVSAFPAPILFIILITACGPNQRILNSSAETPVPVSNAQTPANTIENDLQAMRNADFNYIYVFRRKDGMVLSADDKKFAGGVTPPEINRRRLSDGERAIILGSNYRLPPEMLKLLTDRFDFTDYSKPESEIMEANSNLNN